MRHTPGPWELSEQLSGSENHKGWSLSATIPGEGGYGTEWCWIADISPVIMDDSGDPSPEGRANAHLIAAAPDLLRLLKSAAQTLRHQPCCGQDPDWITSCRNIASFAEEAISNAEATQTTTDGPHSTPEATPGSRLQGGEA
jgi:hypothetical protein